MLVIGLAGGIASGKSFVAACFVRLGCERINADEIGHQVLMEAEVIEAIVSQWGESVLQSNGQIDRQRLGQRVFQRDASQSSDEERSTKKDYVELKILESITHPRIGDRIQKQLDQFKLESAKQAIVLDAPVMFKAGWDQVCDRIVFVDAEISVRRQRAAERGWPADELERRESFQLSIDQKRSRSTDVIDNSKSQDVTFQQVTQLWQDWNLNDETSKET